ncbi:MAG: hypothetical protein R3303_01110 [Marinobacter sp.]|nr:hypothetical protein [Marinobacter sp.]
MDVFLASTPFQLMGCTEARHHFGSQDYRLLVVRPDNKTTVRQMRFLLDEFGWPRDRVIWLSKVTFYPKVAALLRRLRRQPIDIVYVGNRGSWLQEIIYLSLQANSLMFLDDGIGSTVLYYRDARAGKSKSRIPDRKRRLLALLGLRIDAKDRSGPLTFFSCFPLVSLEAVQVVQHDFPAFRQHFGLSDAPDDRNRGSDVGYLGQRHGKTELRRQLVQHLTKLRQRHPAPSRIVYLMHRKQTRDDIEDILHASGVEAQKSRLPIEIEVALAKTRFKAFYGFTSTALYTLKVMFPWLDVYQIEDPLVAAAVHYPPEMSDLFRQAGVLNTVL